MSANSNRVRIELKSPILKAAQTVATKLWVDGKDSGHQEHQESPIWFIQSTQNEPYCVSNLGTADRIPKQQNHKYQQKPLPSGSSPFKSDSRFTVRFTSLCNENKIKMKLNIKN